MRAATALYSQPTPARDAVPAWNLPDRGKVGMLSIIIAESAMFTIFVVAYLFYLGKSLSGPTPRDVLEVPIFYTVCLLSSSLTIHLAAKRLRTRRSAHVPGVVVADDSCLAVCSCMALPANGTG